MLLETVALQVATRLDHRDFTFACQPSSRLARGMRAFPAERVRKKVLRERDLGDPALAEDNPHDVEAIRLRADVHIASIASGCARDLTLLREGDGSFRRCDRIAAARLYFDEAQNVPFVSNDVDLAADWLSASSAAQRNNVIRRHRSIARGFEMLQREFFASGAQRQMA